METLAFTYYTASYENPCNREGKPINLPDAPPIGLLMGTVALLSILSANISPSYAIAYRLGSRGDTVMQIQQALGIAADGIYGAQTERAVRDYQKRQNLQWVDGIAGKETLSTLGLSIANNTGGQILQAVVRTPDRQGINLRSTPNGAKIGGLSDGTSISLTGEERQIGGYRWVKIARGGWLAKPFLQPVTVTKTTQQQIASSPISTQARVTTPSKVGANLRRTPNGERVGSLPEGTLVILTGQERSQGGYTWAQTHQGTWIAKDFLQGIETQSLANSGNSSDTFIDPANRFVVDPAALTQNFQGDRGQFPATQNAKKYDRPDGNAIGSVQKGEKLRVTRERSLANGIAWAKLADGSWVDSRAIGF